MSRRLDVEENFGIELDHTVYAPDSSAIDLCCSISLSRFSSDEGSDQASYAAGSSRSILTFIHISDRKLHNVDALDLLVPEPGAFYVMDRAYLHFERLFQLNPVGAFFVIRSNSKLSGVGFTPIP